MINRTGARPVVAGTAPIRAYQELLGELDEALHGDTTLDRVRELLNRCAAILRQLFLPPDLRHAELDALARTESVTEDAVETLMSLIAGPNHLRHFLSQISSPAWLGPLTETGILDPPSESGPWPVFAAVDRLAPNHGPALAHWLERLFNRNAIDATRVWFVARAAVDVGVEAAPLVLRALREHGEVPAIAALGVWAVEKLDPPSELVEEFADVLLNEASWRSASYVDPVIERLLGGLEAANAARRLRLLCWKLRGVGTDEGSRPWLCHERAGSIAAWTDDGCDDRFAVLLHALIETVRRSQGWIPVTDVLAVVDLLPDDIRGRVRARVLAGSPEVDVSVVVDELGKAIAERDPTGDDLPLLDRVAAEGIAEGCGPRWAQALGPAPSVVELAQRLSTHDLPPEWFRAFHWVGVLPETATAPWAQSVSVMAAVYGRPSREALETRQPVEVSSGQSPMSSEELESLSVTEAAAKISAWRPDPSEWLVSGRELARTLEAVVATDAVAWLASPLRVATELRHPTYIHHYLRSVAEAIKSGTYPPVGETLDTVRIVKAHPWPADRLGKDDFEYDHDWLGADQAAVDVLKALADKDRRIRWARRRGLGLARRRGT